MRNSLIASLLALSGITALPLHGAVIVSTGFESPGYALGNVLSSATPLAANNNTGAVIVNQTTATPFGATNQFLVVNGTNAQFTATAAGLTQLTTIHFDIFEPTGPTGTMSFGLAQNDLNTNATGSYTAWSINNGAITLGANTSLASGSLPTLTVARAYKAFILFNDSATTQMASTPAGGSVSLTAGQTGLFFWDTTTSTLIDGGRYATTMSADPTKFLIRAFSNSKNELYIDNFTREDTLSFAAVPEPSAALLGALGALALLRRKR